MKIAAVAAAAADKWFARQGLDREPQITGEMIAAAIESDHAEALRDDEQR